MPSVSRLILPVIFFSAALGVVAQNPPPLTVEQPSYFKEIGFEDLRLRLGKSIPDGQGVSVMQVEPSEVPPGKNHQVANYPKLESVFGPNQSKRILKFPAREKSDYPKDTPPIISGHSTMVAQLLYGKNSIAPEITDLTLISPETEFVPQWLGFPKGKVKVDKECPKISSHSYVEDQQIMTDLVRRMDHFINQNNHIAVVAVGKNGKGDPVAPLFGSSYNAIVVGLSSGSCANGLTKDNGDGPGRSKPDIVVPVRTTSEATPIVAAACALLVQTGNEMPSRETATLPPVIKACLMAGADKTFDSVKLSGGWARDKKIERSLHPQVGAGQLNIDLAHRILKSGPQTSGPEGLRKELNGWTYDSLPAKAVPKTYYIDIPDEQQSIAITAALTWNRRFESETSPPIVPMYELALGRLDAKGEFERVIDISQSKIDNAEIVWSTAKLDPGRYGLRVRNTGDHESNYALAWTVTTKAAPGIFRPQVRKPSNTDLKWVYVALAAAIMVIIIFLWKFRFMFITMSKAPRR
ncbi:MAG: hypothetical protein U0798_01350 [Gemmataceae bacterium]